MAAAVQAIAVPRLAAQETMRLNYVNADIRDVIRSLASVLGVNVLITEDIPARRVTYTTPQPVPLDQIGEVLEAILESEGLVLVRRGPVSEVVPADQAPATGSLQYGKTMDGTPPLGLTTQLVPLENVRAEEARDILQQFVTPGARVEIVPRSNALLVTDRGVHVARYLELLAQLDVPSRGEGGLQTYVYRLKHARAADLAVTLGHLYGVTVPAAGASPSEMIANRSLSRTLQQFQQRELDAATRPVETVPAASETGAAGADSTGALVGRTLIVPDQATNALVIRTAPPNYPVLESTIQELDARPAQVLLEVHIAEITLDKSTAFGINWSVFQQNNSTAVTGRFGAQAFADSALSGIDDFLVRVVDLKDTDVRAVLRALATEADVHVLSTPRVLALNNEAARILVGSEVPFNQSARAGLDVGSGLLRTVQYRNVGTELNIIPTINDDGYVLFRILQQVSQLTDVTLESALGAPVIQTREAETSALVADGQTIVIGGLIGETTDRVRNGIPILKDIPILGYLFGSTSTRRQRTELAIFVTPYVVMTDEDADRLLQEQGAILPNPEPGGF
jgi:general secretion pathway protein D